MFSILGANGTGKSTLLKCIIGELKARSGSILIDNIEVGEYSTRELAKKIAYIPQNHYPIFPFLVNDIVMMGRASRMGYFSNPGKTEREIAMEKELNGVSAILKNGEMGMIGSSETIITNENLSDLYDINVTVETFGDKKICIPGGPYGELEREIK